MILPAEKLSGCFVGDYAKPLYASVQAEILLKPQHSGRRCSLAGQSLGFFQRAGALWEPVSKLF
jgi:hypothetical protein